MMLLLEAVTNHPSVQDLHLDSNRLAEHAADAAIGAAFAALVAADAPSLTELNVSHSWLDERVLGPLCDSLPQNTHLRVLDFRGSRLDDHSFVATRLVPLRANTEMDVLW